MAHHLKSPLEYGEVDSPEDYSPTNSVEIVVNVGEQSEELDETPRYGDDQEEGLGPDIKPPQAKIKKDKHKSHKRDKHKSRDKSKSERYGERRGKSSNSKQRSVVSSRSSTQRSGGGGTTRVIERRGAETTSVTGVEKDRTFMSKEEEHRDRSNRERERLERLEMERLRLDREIMRRELQQREKLQKEQQERDRKQRSQVVRVKSSATEVEKKRSQTSLRPGGDSRREMVSQQQQQGRQSSSKSMRSRSPQTRRVVIDSASDGAGRSYKDYREGASSGSSLNSSSSSQRLHRGEGERPKSSLESSRKRKSEEDLGKSGRHSSASVGGDYGHSRERAPVNRKKKTSARVATEIEEDKQHGKEVEVEDVNKEEEINNDVNNHSEESESESDSDSSSSEESHSDSDSSSEEENKEDQEEEVAKIPDRVRSRFDSASENEADRSGDRHSNHSDRESEPGSDAQGGEREGEYIDYLTETPTQSPVELLPDLPPYFPAIQGCRNVDEFNCLHRIEEGTYGVVYQAMDKKTDEIVALKRLKMEKEKEGFPITSLREINTLLKAQHENIVHVREIVVGSNMDRIYIVMDYVEHDLKSLMEYRMKDPFTVGEVKTLIMQLLSGVGHLHDNWIIHRDLKTSNLLLSHRGILKIADFGLAREYGSPLKPYTPIVVTLWYRAPELLLGTKEYSCPIDMWSVGCIMAEFLTKKPLFPGKSEIDELNRIFKELGTPNEKIWPGVVDLKGWKNCTFADHPYNQLRNRFGSLLTDKGFELLNRFLTYNPSKRITAEEAKKHYWLHGESPTPVPSAMFPTWPTKADDHKHRKSGGGNSPKPPSGGKAYASLLQDDAAGFHLPGVASGGGFALKF